MRKRSKALVLFLLMMVMSICGVFSSFAAVVVPPDTMSIYISGDGSVSNPWVVHSSDINDEVRVSNGGTANVRWGVDNTPSGASYIAVTDSTSVVIAYSPVASGRTYVEADIQLRGRGFTYLMYGCSAKPEVGKSVPSSSSSMLTAVVKREYPGKECVTGVRKLEEGYSSDNDKTAANAGVPVGSYYMFFRSLAHGGNLVNTQSESQSSDTTIYTYTYEQKVPCGVYVVVGQRHQRSDSNCHLVYPIPGKGGISCGTYLSSKYAVKIDSSFLGTKNGSCWVDATNNNSSHTNKYIWNVSLYHGDTDGDGLCDGCNQPTDGEELTCSHTNVVYGKDTNEHWCECADCGTVISTKAKHYFSKKYYSENGVENSYYQMGCVCGAVQGDKVYEKTTVHYDMNGGTGTISDKQVDRGKAYKVSANMPERTGYTFTGWSTTKNGAVQFQGDDITYPSGTTYTLYACWEARKFQIYFDKGPESQPITVTYGQPIGTLPDSGTTGWCEEITRQPVDSTTVYNFNESITLIPRDDKEYITVSFISDSESMTFQSEKGVVVSPPFVPTPGSGFTFKWWSTSRNGSEFDFSQTIYQDTTFYAVIEGNKIKLTLLGVGTREYAYGATIGDLPEATQQGATFEGWYWDAECTQPVTSEELVPAYDVTLYPKFELVKFTVTLEGHGTIEISQYDLIPELPTPEVDGQTFRGWFLNDGTQIKKNDEYIWNYPITLYPKYETTQWVVSLPNGESRLVYDGDAIGQIPTGSVSAGTRVIGFKDSKGNVVDSTTIVRGNMTIIPVLERARISLTLMDGDTQYTVRDADAGLRVTDLPTLSKAGYTFRGWSQGGGGMVTTGPFYSDTTLYAVYAADKQVITLNELNQTVEKATGTQIGSLPVPTKEGHEFKWWTYNGVPVTAETIVPAGGMNLYPVWEKITVDTTRYVTVRYWSDGIRINTVDMNPGEILYDPGAPALNDLQKTEGRAFAYWSTRSGGQYTFGKRVSADLDLYAVWN